MKMITHEELKNEMERLGYYPTEELVFEAWNGLFMFGLGEINPGQDIFAACLEGPPGAGKTFYAETYCKLAKQIYNEEVSLVEYQCDATTGKTELFEDINISAAIRGDADKVNVPGKLIEAVKLVNTGKKVVLFIDEYDKAREETDAFLLQFLQSGKINATQHGDLGVIDKYKSNLQVILCKNDFREELSGPLSRRLRIIRLDYMTPEIFHKTAHRVLVEEREKPVNDGLMNMVTLMYNLAYKEKEKYNRLPSCSEMLIALEDANRLLYLANAPQYIIYHTIIKNMFKSLDDIKTFENSLTKNKELLELVKDMKNKDTSNKEVDINSIIASKVFVEENKKLVENSTKMKELITKYQKLFQELKKKEENMIGENSNNTETSKINLDGGKLVSTNRIPNVISNFDDSTDYVKRGQNILELSENDWTLATTIKLNDLSDSNFHMEYINYLIENAEDFGLVMYENGVLLNPFDDKLKLVAIRVGLEYKIMSNYQVIPSNYLTAIKGFVYLVRKFIIEKNIQMNADSNSYGIYNINSLIYDSEDLNYDKIADNVYSVEISGDIDKSTEFENIAELQCVDIESAINASNSIMNQKVKTKTKKK